MTRQSSSSEAASYNYDSQLGITVLKPDPFFETAARLKHINNEVGLAPDSSL